MQISSSYLRICGKRICVFPMVLSMGMAEAIRDLRVGAGFDQKKLAAKAKVNQGDISHYEIGDRSPRIDHILAIERACGVPRGTAFVMAGLVEAIPPVAKAIAVDEVLSPSDKDSLRIMYESLLQSPRARAAGPKR